MAIIYIRYECPTCTRIWMIIEGAKLECDYCKHKKSEDSK